MPPTFLLFLWAIFGLPSLVAGFVLDILRYMAAGYGDCAVAVCSSESGRKRSQPTQS